MKRIRLIFWLIVITLVVACIHIGIDFNGYELREGRENTLLITFHTQKYAGKYDLRDYYEHTGIAYKMRSHNASFFVGIIAPIIMILMALLFGPIVTRQIGRLSGEND